MKIVICDDQRIVFEEMAESIKRFDSFSKDKIELLYFSKPSFLLEYMQSNRVDIVFMDLEFCDASEDGIKWLRKMKKQLPYTIFIILTAYENRYKEGYEVRAFRFMTKPINDKELFEYLTVSMEELQLRKGVTVIRRGIEHTILLQDILYISAQSGGTELWTRTDLFLRDESLLQWEQMLPDNIFFRCHNKYLVNMSHIINFENQMIELVNGEKVPVSRRRWKEFQLAYMKYDTRDYRLF